MSNQSDLIRFISDHFALQNALQKKPRRSGALYPDDTERADDVPKVFTRIHVYFVLTGAGLDPHKVERAIKLSANRYCSASIMLNKTAEMTHDFEIVEQ